MNASERRRGIIQVLQKEEGPISAKQLADRFQVSRQIIVGDVALLRAEGQEIFSSPRGYLFEKKKNRCASLYSGKVVCQHTAAQAERELQIIVDNGGETVDVEVEHPIYGNISSTLHIRSRHDIQEFLGKMTENEGKMLSSLTDGIHLHTIQCQSEEDFQRIKAELRKAKILYESES